MIKTYIQLIKPGYIIANVFTAAAGFLLATKTFSPLLFVGSLMAIAFGMAAACVVNNYIDRDIDGKMERTKRRALVTGQISTKKALIYAAILSVISLILFIIFSNLITLCVGAIGILFYLVFYSISKRKTSWSTLIGSVPGATVPVAGYTAVTGNIDVGAILLFFILIFWQLPHFYAIAIYRRQEYKNARIPVLPVAKGIRTTKIQMFLYSIAFAIAAVLLSLTGYTGKIYLVVISIMSVTWIAYAVIGFFSKDVNQWAKKMFLLSLVINMVWCIMILLNHFVV